MKVVVSMVVKEKVVEARGVSLAVKVVVSMAAKEKVVEARGASRAAKVVVSMVAKEKAVEARGANRRRRRRREQGSRYVEPNHSSRTVVERCPRRTGCFHASTMPQP